jgi:hypothetical protein
VDQRAAAERSDGQPVLRVVPQMMAAGWHGMGTVRHAFCSYEICSSKILSTDPVRVLDRGQEFDFTSNRRKGRLASELPCRVPESAPGSVNGPTWGSLAGLERMGLSSTALDELRQLLLEVNNEYLLCLLLIHALLQEHKPDVLGLGRDEARRVRREASSQQVGPVLLVRVAEIARLALQS